MHEWVVGVGEGVKAKNEKWLSARNTRVRSEGRKGGFRLACRRWLRRVGEGRRKAVDLGMKVDGFRLKVRRFSGRVAAKGRKRERHTKKTADTGGRMRRNS